MAQDLNKFFNIKVTLVACLLLSACHTQKATTQTSIQQSVTTLDESIALNEKLQTKRNIKTKWQSAEVLPELSNYLNPQKKSEQRFDVTATKVPAQKFFMGLVAGSNINMLVHPNVSGDISLKLKNVTLREAMEAVHDLYGYDYHRTSYGYEVAQPQLETQLFHINYLDVQRTGRSFTQLTSGQVSNKVGTSSTGNANNNLLAPNNNNNTAQTTAGMISSIETKSEMQFWKDIDKSIKSMLPDDNQHIVVVNSQAGVISIRAYPGELRRINNFINRLQASLNRQVILEAKILEVTLNDQFQAGIDWSVLGNPATAGLNGTGETLAGMGQAGNSLIPGTDLNALNGMFAIRVNGNFRVLINLLNSQGNVQVLSSPHISTVNNQKAVIKVGNDEFFVTGVSTSNTIIGTNTIPSQDVKLTPFFSGITLDVTPEISSDNTVVLHIHPSVSNVTEQTKVIGLGNTSNSQPNNLTLPLARSTIRESDNIVRAKNGQVVVIGGLMQNLTNETIASTPGLGKVPFIGSLFRRTKQQSIKSELVILLRPIIATNRVEIDKLTNEKETFEIFRRPFHAGGMPKVFGNEAERDKSF